MLDYNGIKSEINSKRNYKKICEYGDLVKHLNAQLITEKTGEMKKFPESNENEASITKPVEHGESRGNFNPINAFLNNQHGLK